MVRFETKLHNNAVKEWIPFYVDYRKLKRLLYTETNANINTTLSPTISTLASPRFRDDLTKSDRIPLRQPEDERLLQADSRTSSDSNDSPTSCTIRPDNVDLHNEPATKSFSSSPLLSPINHSNDETAFAGPPPQGTRWSSEAWHQIKLNVMGTHLNDSSSTEARKLSDVDLVYETELSNQYEDINGELSQSPSKQSDMQFRTQLLCEIAKVDTFYNDMVYDYQNQLKILTSQARTTEELGNARRRERAKRKQNNQSSSTLSPGSRRGSNTSTPRNSLLSSSKENNNNNNNNNNNTSTPLRLSQLSRSSSTAIEHDIETLRDMDSPSREALALASSKRAYADLYRNMCYLENYCILNYTALVKIIKKHDKINSIQYAMKPILQNLKESSFFSTFQSLTLIKSQHHELYAKVFCSSDKDVARAELLLKRNNLGTQTAAPFLLGFRFGICLLLFSWILWDVVVDFWINQQKGWIASHKCHTSAADRNVSIASQWFEKDFPVYRGMGSLIVWLWCWGLCLFVWNSSRINYLFMLELDPRTTSTYTEVWETASSMSIILMTSFIIHFKVVICDFPGTFKDIQAL